MNHVNPYASPEISVEDLDNEEYPPQIFSIHGRIGRLRYFGYSCLMIFMSFIILFIASFVIAGLMPDNTPAAYSPDTFLVIIGLLNIPMLVTFIILAKRRLNDLNRSGRLPTLVFFLLLNILFVLYLLLRPGTKGRNAYGPAPAPNSAGIVIFDVFALVFFIGVIAAMTIPNYNGIPE